MHPETERLLQAQRFGAKELHGLLTAPHFEGRGFAVATFWKLFEQVIQGRRLGGPEMAPAMPLTTTDPGPAKLQVRRGKDTFHSDSTAVHGNNVRLDHYL